MLESLCSISPCHRAASLHKVLRERPPAAEREHCHKFEAALASTTSDIQTEMDRMGVVVAGAEPAHEVLGVAPDAPDEEVRQAFRAIASESHPDVSEDGGERFKRAKKAKETMTR